MAKIPDTVPDAMAVYCCDMLSTGFMGAEHGNIPIGGTVAVLAQGPVGLMSTAGARRGCCRWLPLPLPSWS